MRWLEAIRDFVEGIGERFGKPEEEEIDWGEPVEAPVEAPVKAEVKPGLREGLPKFSWDWRGLRLRAFNVMAILFLVVNVAAVLFFAFAPQAVAFIAVAYLVPNTFLLIHYRRLLGREREKGKP